jgi:hypothetical protein
MMTAVIANQAHDLSDDFGLLDWRISGEHRISASNQEGATDAYNSMCHKSCAPSIHYNVPRTQALDTAALDPQYITRPDGRYHAESGNSETSFAILADYIGR